jgi:phage terminase small subunit
LTKPDLREYIDEQLKKLHDAKIADADEVIKYLTSVMRGESTAEVVVIEGEGEGCSTARRMSKAPDEKERLKAAELLGKRFGLFTDKINVDGGTKVVIVDDLDE